MTQLLFSYGINKDKMTGAPFAFFSIQHLNYEVNLWTKFSIKFFPTTRFISVLMFMGVWDCDLSGCENPSLGMFR